MKTLSFLLLILFVPSICQAQELTASYYDISSLKRDGQWKLTKGVMANGRQFSDDKFTCASWDFPLNTWVKVTRQDTGAFVVVMVTDKTARRFKGKRVDLSPVAFKTISPSGTLKEGLLKVSVEKIGGEVVLSTTRNKKVGIRYAYPHRPDEERNIEIPYAHVKAERQPIQAYGIAIFNTEAI